MVTVVMSYNWADILVKTSERKKALSTFLYVVKKKIALIFLGSFLYSIYI